MKKITLLILLFLSITIATNAQTEVKINRPEFSQSTTTKFRLFPTQNLWIFIKLDTSNGKLWVVQYSMDANNRFEVALSAIPRCPAENAKNGRFTLYATNNIYTFIMLDQVSGKLWQVQWGNNIDNFMMVEIN